MRYTLLAKSSPPPCPNVAATGGSTTVATNDHVERRLRGKPKDTNSRAISKEWQTPKLFVRGWKIKGERAIVKQEYFKAGFKKTKWLMTDGRDQTKAGERTCREARTGASDVC